MADEIFVDTSALYSLVVRADENHAQAAALWQRFAQSPNELTTHSYVVVEATALLQRREGLLAVSALANVLAVVAVHWVDRDLHARAFTVLLSGGRRNVSFVDEVSFEFMREKAIRRAFAFDDDFRAAGFEVLPTVG